MEHPEVPGELKYGYWVGRDLQDRAGIGCELHRFIHGGRYTGVFVNVLGGEVEANLMRYLPREVFRVMIVHSITRGTYRFARCIRDNVHLTVGVSPRIRNDLVQMFGFPEGHTISIFNAVDTTRFDSHSRAGRKCEGPLRLISLGRLEETSKQLSLLPRILRGLGDQSVTLTVAGDGPDREMLRLRLAPFGDRVRFIGPVPPSEVPRVFADHHVFIMPSRFEGFGLTIIEAMAAGIVPVVSRIPGVTDAIITHERDGFLFPVGNAGVAASLLRRLNEDRECLYRLSHAAHNRARDDCFSLRYFGSSYANAIKSRLANPRRLPPPLPLREWSIHPRLRGQPWIPSNIRPLLARLYYRFRR